VKARAGLCLPDGRTADIRRTAAARWNAGPGVATLPSYLQKLWRLHVLASMRAGAENEEPLIDLESLQFETATEGERTCPF